MNGRCTAQVSCATPLACSPRREAGRLLVALMRVLVQRVSQAAVMISGRTVGAIDRGLLLLVGFNQSDTPESSAWMADQVCGLRIFPDADEKMNRSLLDIGGGLLVVSQFTLYGDASKGK